MKFLFTVTFLICSTILPTAQEVQTKKGIVYIDEKECLKYDGGDVPGVTYSTNSGEELFFIGYARDYAGGTYWKVTFLKDKQTMNYRVNFVSKKAFLTKLAKEKLLKDCTLDQEKIATFIAKYNENIN